VAIEKLEKPALVSRGDPKIFVWPSVSLVKDLEARRRAGPKATYREAARRRVVMPRVGLRCILSEPYEGTPLRPRERRDCPRPEFRRAWTVRTGQLRKRNMDLTPSSGGQMLVFLRFIIF
jgi:hypothetical protein